MYAKAYNSIPVYNSNILFDWEYGRHKYRFYLMGFTFTKAGRFRPEGWLGKQRFPFFHACVNNTFSRLISFWFLTIDSFTSVFIEHTGNAIISIVIFVAQDGRVIINKYLAIFILKFNSGYSTYEYIDRNNHTY